MTKQQDIKQMQRSLAANGFNAECAFFLAELRADVNEMKGLYEKEPTP